MHALISKLILAQTAFAQTSPGGGLGGGTAPGGGLGGGTAPTKSLQQILDDLIAFSVGLGLTIAALMIILAAYQILTAGGNEEQFTKGKKTITYTVVGIFILLLSAAIINIIKEIIGVA